MSCVLRISGESLDVDAMLSGIDLQPNRVWRKGEPGVLKGKFHSRSGANFIISDADFDNVDIKIEQTTQFLELHSSAISKMVNHSGVDSAYIDFAVSIYESSAAQFTSLPPKLIKLAASAGLGIEISVYACSADDE